MKKFFVFLVFTAIVGLVQGCGAPQPAPEQPKYKRVFPVDWCAKRADDGRCVVR